ncbi:MAG TPA: large-conductance mechanosensitive channel protein MscL [Bacillota bacterium]|nr:large-conductance mechanosensitive channel protein MscL [Bacillota bacterium]
MFEEFKKFAIKGNVIDLAVGVVIGGAFSKIVTSLVEDLIMPIMGFITGRIDLSALELVVRADSNGTTELAIKYGKFLQSTIDFLIIAFSIFLFIKAINRIRKMVDEKPDTATDNSKTEILLTEIRNLLKQQK